jgi:hypothetical protein
MLNRREPVSRDPRRGLPSVAECRRTNYSLQVDLRERAVPAGLPLGSSHRFQIGQNVRMSLGPMQRIKSISCTIVKILPFEGTFFQYRVKGTDEPFERIANEHELMSLASPAISDRASIFRGRSKS